jgi:hypothetical protein
MNREFLAAISGLALAGWLLVFGQGNPSLLFILTSVVVVSLALVFGAVISERLGSSSQNQPARQNRLVQVGTMIAWVALAFWVLSAISRFLTTRK